MDFAYSSPVDEAIERLMTFANLGVRPWSCECNSPLTRSSNKFKPLLETRHAKPFACPQDINPRLFLKIQRKVASRRWRRSGRYSGQTFDEFESLARSRFSALEDRWFW